MRIVGGELSGRRLLSPATSATRPTTDKVREAIFNALYGKDLVEDGRVVDLFAGTGAWGIEALSRGAAHATFVEKNPRGVRVIERNLEELGLTDRATVYRGDVRGFLGQFSAKQSAITDVVFADPPYEFSEWSSIFEAVEAKMLICESDNPISPGNQEKWHLEKSKNYGDTLVSYFVPADHNNQDFRDASEQ